VRGDRTHGLPSTPSFPPGQSIHRSNPSRIIRSFASFARSHPYPLYDPSSGPSVFFTPSSLFPPNIGAAGKCVASAEQSLCAQFQYGGTAMSRLFDDDWKAATAVILALILLIIWLWMNRNGGGGGGRRKGGGGRMAVPAPARQSRTES
jgi:hypothetical protein